MACPWVMLVVAIAFLLVGGSVEKNLRSYISQRNGNVLLSALIDDTNGNSNAISSINQQRNSGSGHQQGNGGSDNQQANSSCYETPSHQQPDAYDYTTLCQDPINEKKRFPVVGVCFAYFECQGGSAIYSQCRQTCSFNPSTMECAPDNSCKTACPMSIDLDPNNPEGYLLGGVPIPCPANTYFDFRICTCDHKRNRPKV